MIGNNFILWPFMVGFGIISVLFVIILIAFVIWMIIDCAQRKFKNDVEKIVWILVILFTKGIGAIVYYIVIRALNPSGLAKK